MSGTAHQTHLHPAPLHPAPAERMLNRLKGLTDPEAKRKAIGAEFIDVFRQVSSWLPGCLMHWGG